MFCLPAGAKYPFSQALAHGLYSWLKKVSCRACLLFYFFFYDNKQLLKALLPCTFILLLLNSFDLLSFSSKLRKRYTYTDESRSAGGRIFLFSCERLGRGLQETVFSSKAVLDVLDMKYKSEFKHGFTNPEVVARRCSVKKVFLEILQNSQENTCAKVSFLIKLQAEAFLKENFQ